MLSRTVREGFPALTVLDSTHPDAVRELERRLDLSRTLFVVSSKSGGTSETISFFKYFWSKYPQSERAGRHFVGITDPGTSLEQLARQRGFRRVFNAPPDVGGRYSALTAFGLLPAALIGVNVPHLLEHARAMAGACAPTLEGADNPAVALGAALADLALGGRDKLTFLVGRTAALLPAWIEQLVAESTGKGGKGIVPVADEPARAAGDYANDRVFVTIGVRGEDEATLADATRDLAAKGHPVIGITLGKRVDLGQEFFRWELATAAAGAVLGIQPFDQPDVQLAKDLSRRAMEAGSASVDAGTAAVSQQSRWREAIVERLCCNCGREGRGASGAARARSRECWRTYTTRPGCVEDKSAPACQSALLVRRRGPRRVCPKKRLPAEAPARGGTTMN